MLSFVAVNQDGMVASVQDRHQSGSDLVRGYRDKRLFVSWNAKLKEGDTVLIEKSRVGFGIFFQDQG